MKNFTFKDKHHTEETKEKLRQKRLGKPGLSGQNNPMSRTNRIKRKLERKVKK